jgi:hypothetical protein
VAQRAVRVSRQAIPQQLRASLDRIRLLREKQAALAAAQIEAENQLLHRAGQMLDAGELDVDGLLSLSAALSPVALAGWTKRWDAAISLEAGLLPNLRKHLNYQRRNAPNQPDGTWRGTWPLNGSPVPVSGVPVVYVLHEADGQPCYTGSSDHLMGRLQAHARDGKPFTWWTASRCADREAAYQLEDQVLRESMPYLNKRRGR